MTDQEYVDYMTRHGFRVEPTLTAPMPGGGMDPASPEAVLLAFVRQEALRQGYLFYHVFTAKRSTPGYPDITLAKPGRLIFAELKSTTGKLTQEQTVWLDVLRHSLPEVEVYCWRPVDSQQIPQILRARKDIHAL